MTAVKLVVVAALAGALPQQAGGPDFAASLTVEPSEVRLEVGETRSLRVIVTDAGGEPVPEAGVVFLSLASSTTTATPGTRR